MRPCRHLTAAAFAFIPLAYSANVPFVIDSPTTASSTLVDVLSADPDFSILLTLLQRARLIPTLNRLNGSTLFAPTNEAIKRSQDGNSFWHTLAHEDASYFMRDNVHERLRQELFYHILNYTITEKDIYTTAKPRTHKTLHYPRQLTEPPGRPPNHPPWMPIPGGTLGGEPQRLRTILREEQGWAGVDSFGNGGARVAKALKPAANGVVVAIDDVLSVPSDLATVISQQTSISYFNRILTNQLSRLLNDTSAMTLFLPEDSAWDVLHPVERLYLESDFASDDLHKILEMHAVVKDGVTWSDSFEGDLNLTTVHGRKLHIRTRGDRVKVSSAELVQSDIYASNGVLHTVSSLLISPGALKLTPEKFLLGLNCTSFVSLLHSVNLENLVNNTEAQYTILAPKDDVLSIYGKDGDIPAPGSEELKRLLQYHFLPGRWVPSKLKDGMLVQTALKPPGLADDNQVLDVQVSSVGDKDRDLKIRFAGASAIGEPIEVNNTVIYFVSRPVTPPTDAFNTVLPNLDLSAFLAAVSSTSLAKQLYTQPRTTLFIPNNDAFKRLGGLVSDYLFRASSKSDLEKIILHHAVNGVEYADSIVNGSAKTYPTYEGTDVHVDRYTNGSVLLSGSGGWAGMSTALAPRNLLTDTGTVHEISDVMIPRSVDITVEKLVKAAKGSTMLSIVTKAGMEWVLNGTAPPENSTWAQAGLTGAELTLLCPTDDAFKNEDLIELYSDIDRLRSIVEQHIIPGPKAPSSWSVAEILNNNRPIRLADDAAYDTALSSSSYYGDVLFRATADGGYIVGIRNTVGTGGHDDWAHVVSWGRTTAGRQAGGVILIDQLLVPYRPAWYRELAPPIAVTVLGVCIILGFFWGVRWVWMRDVTEATYAPIGGALIDDD